MIKKFETYLADIQSVSGTGESLAAADYIEVLDSSKLDVIPEFDDNPTVKGSFYQNPKIAGATRTEVQLDFNMRSIGTANSPDWAKMMKAAGFTLTPALVGIDYRYTLAPDNATSDATIWKYSGSKESGGSLLEEASNVVFDWKISGETNKKVVLSLTGKGCLQAEPLLSTCPDCSSYYNTSITPAFIDYTAVIQGLSAPADVGLLKFELSGNNVVEQKISGSGYGYGISKITDKRVKFSAQLYSDINSSALISNMFDQDTAAMSFIWGPTNNKITIYLNNAQIYNIKKNYVGNYMVYDIEGDMVLAQSSFYITINSDIS